MHPEIKAFWEQQGEIHTSPFNEFLLFILNNKYCIAYYEDNKIYYYWNSEEISEENLLKIISLKEFI